MEKNFIVVGSVLPADVAKELSLRTKELTTRLDEEVTVVELTPLEMELIMQGRKNLLEHQSITTFLQDSVKREQLLGWVQKFMKEIGGHTNSYKSELKKLTNLSWKDFNALFDSLEMFGFVASYPNGVVEFLVDDEAIRSNGAKRIQEKLNELSKEIEIIAIGSKFDKAEMKKITLLRKKLNYEQPTAG